MQIVLVMVGGFMLGLTCVGMIFSATSVNNSILIEKGVAEWRADPQTGKTTLHFFIDDEKVEEKN